MRDTIQLLSSIILKINLRDLKSIKEHVFYSSTQIVDKLCIFCKLFIHCNELCLFYVHVMNIANIDKTSLLHRLIPLITLLMQIHYSFII